MWKDSRGRWIWGTCVQPPSRQEIDHWISENLLTVNAPSNADQEMEDVELPTIVEEQDYGKRPDSPDYDESSNFFFTPRSLRALTTGRKRAHLVRDDRTLYRVSAIGRGSEHRRTKDRISVGRFDRTSELSGTSASDSSRWRKQRRSETRLKIPEYQAAQQLIVCCIEIHAASRYA